MMGSMLILYCILCALTHKPFNKIHLIPSAKRLRFSATFFECVNKVLEKK